jgi:hypothetical protein
VEAQPAGGQFQVNSFTTEGQYFPAVAMDPGGRFVVAWQSRTDGSHDGIAVQRFSRSGTPRGAEFLANGYTTLRQHQAAVAMDASGGFVVAWNSVDQDGSSYGIRRRRFDAQGNALGGGAARSTPTRPSNRVGRVAMSAAGDFVVVWNSPGDGDYCGIFGQRFGDLIFENGFQ